MQYLKNDVVGEGVAGFIVGYVSELFRSIDLPEYIKNHKAWVSAFGKPPLPLRGFFIPSDFDPTEAKRAPTTTTMTVQFPKMRSPFALADDFSYGVGVPQRKRNEKLAIEPKRKRRRRRRRKKKKKQAIELCLLD